MDASSGLRDATMRNASRTCDDGTCSTPGAPGLTSSLLSVLLAPQTLATLFVLYAAACSALRFRAEKALRRRFAQYSDRASMAAMTNDDAQSILRHIITLEFPFMYKTSLQLAINKTYGIETISKLLAATKSFSDPATAPKRYEDTAIIFSEFSLFAPKSDRCIKAIARMNYLHSSYQKAGKISNADLLYTLSVCVSEPIRFIGLYEWRALNALEVNALGTFWKSIGDAMEISYDGFLSKTAWRDGTEFAEDLLAWAKQYEVDHMKPATSNRVLVEPLMEMLVYHTPRAMRPFVLQVVLALMGERLREACMYPEPSNLATTFGHAALLVRQFVLRYLTLPRLIPDIAVSDPDPQTGRIHHNDYLLEPLYVRPTVWNRWGPVALFTRLMGGFVPGAKRFVPEGYLFEEIGPKGQMGKGQAAMQAWEEKMGRERPSGCPFSH